MDILNTSKYTELANKTAVVFEDKNLTYSELDILSSKIATKLKNNGVLENDFVVLFLPRGVEIFACIFAALKLGAYYVPLEDTIPKERLNYIKNNCSAKLVIDVDFLKDLDENVLEFDKNNSGGCVIYTSGSTGNPKGVKISKPAILSQNKSASEVFSGNSDVNFLYILQMSFVAHIVYPLRFLFCGGTVHLASNDVRKDIIKIEDYILKNNITQIIMPPQMYKHFDLKKSSLEKVFLAGEKITNLERCGDFELYNSYGSTETLWSTYFKIDKRYENTPIGKPFKCHEILLLDKDNKIVDTEGEIAVSGCISDGYIDLEEDTKEKYIQINGKTYFKTGDIAKYDENGDLLYLNRNDWMIKINGQRVEPSEVEAVVKRFKNITESVVKGFKSDYNQAYLCCYFTANEKVDIAELKEYLSNSLNSYMIPSFFVQVDNFILNQNGKINRKMLVAPDISVYRTEFVAPETELEKDLCNAFEKVLKLENIGVNDDFFALGGDSIKVVELTKELEKYSVESSDVFLGKTPKGISDIVGSKTEQKISLFTTGGKNSALTQGQMGVYFECIQNTKNLVYNLPFACALPKEVEEQKLYDAILKVIKNYSAFGVCFEEIDGEIRMISQKPFIDIEIKNSNDIEATKKDFVRPFDMQKGNLARFEIVRTAESVYLLMDIHHIISDGTSIELILNAISKAYFDETLEPEKVDLFAAAKVEENLVGTEAYQKAYEFFKSQFEANDLENTLLEDETSETREYSAKTFNVNLSGFINSTELNSCIRKHGITESTFFMGACAWALCKAIGNSECLLTTVDNGRHYSQLNKTVGMLVHTLPLAIKLDEENKPSEYLSSLQDLFFETMSNDCYPFFKLAKEFNINNDVAFVYQAEMLNNMKFGDDIIPVEFIDTNWAISKITVHVFKKEDNYKLMLNYRADLYSEETISMFVMLMKQAMKGFVEDKTIKDISLVDSETLENLESCNSTIKNESELLVLDMFKEQVTKNPDKIAVVSGDTKLTYKDLDKISDKLACYLVKKGIKKEDVVAILSERNEYMAICSLAVIKSGAMYQPLDNTYPAERLNFMLKDSDAKMLITPKSLRELVEFDGEIFYTEDVESLERCSVELPKQNQEDAFVILYTSGSTGLPKGCILEHGNFATFFKFYNKKFNIDETSNVMAYSSFGFDANVLDTYATLCAGATVCIVPLDIRLDMPKLNDYFEKNNVTHGFMTTQVGRLFATTVENHSLKTLIIGGESLTSLEPPKNYKLFNAYGPTETTCMTNFFAIDKFYKNTPIGNSNCEVKLYVVDKDMKRVPFNVAGELLIAGPQVSRGYLNRPELTEKVFIENPFTNDVEYKRMYRTGDIVRMLPDGNIQFVGRKDSQVKIRGFRIELTEVEEVIRRFNPVKDATVVAFDDVNGGKYIAAYVVSDENINVNELNEFIKAEKPAYMVPAVTIQIDEIPLNQNAKVNKRALPKPVREAENIVLPQTEMQQMIYDVVSDVLGHKDFGINSDLYFVGLTSISTIKLNSRLYKEFEKAITIRELKENSTVEKLANFFLKKNEDTEFECLTYYPLTKTQEGIFSDCLANQNSTFYNIPILFTLDKKTDIDRLKKAIVDTINAHKFVLSTIQKEEDGDICWHKDNNVLFNKSDIEEVEYDSIDAAKENICKPFEIYDSRLFRIKIVSVGEEKKLYIDFHHIIFDGESLRILLSDIDSAYNGAIIEPEIYTGFDDAQREQQLRSSDAYQKSKEYYHKTFADCDEDSLPVADAYAGMQENREIVKFSEILDVNTVKDFCRRFNLTENALFLSAFGLLLSKYQNSDKALFTTIYNGRSDVRLDRTFSMLVKTLPVLCDIKDDVVVDYIKSIANQLTESCANDIYSFAEISHDLDIKANVMFVCQNEIYFPEEFCGGVFEYEQMSLDKQKVPFALTSYIEKGQYKFVCEYDNNLYGKDFINDFVENYETVVKALLKTYKLSDVQYLSEDVVKRLDTLNKTEPITEFVSVVDMFKEQVAKNSDKIAVVSGDTKLTYKELDEISDKLACYLVKKGIKKEDVVAILSERNEYMTICSLAVIKSGAMYQPLDNTYPAERLNFMLKDSGAKMLITPKSLRELVEFDGEIFYTEDVESLERCSVELPKSNKEDAFVILYTSGSTGLPKGCILENGNLSAFLKSFIKKIDINESSNFAAYASFGFDANLNDIYSALCSGATLYVIPLDMRLDMPKLNDYFNENNITHVFMTTQVGRQFVTTVDNKSLKTLVVGGETLTPVEPPKGFKFVNGYGPTETTCGVTFFEVDKFYQNIPIGKHCDNVKLYVVDKSLNRLPFGAVGELLIAGPQVSRGYLNRPKLIEKVFIENPFTDEVEYKRMYRTGDSVRMLSDGNIQFIGRKDSQIKIRGFRIELTEVEEVIRRFNDVKDATVVAFDDVNGGKYIAAYVVSDENINVNELNEFIKAEKPAYMVPAVTIQIDEIPLTQNHKVNKKALPMPDIRQSAKIGKEPSDEIEMKLCMIFAKALGVTRVFVDDDFFEIGGTSLLASKVAVDCMVENFPVSYADIFELKTAEKLAKFLKKSLLLNQDVIQEADDENQNPILAHNSVKYVDEIIHKSIGNVLLCGATGFLGVHILKELLDTDCQKIYCLVRRNKLESSVDRLKTLLMYYFDERFDKEFDKNRIEIIESDITDENLFEKLQGYEIDTIINSAAIVKHFTVGDEIEQVNVGGVENLINFAKTKDIRLIQISTLSVAGESIDDSVSQYRVLTEKDLDIGQTVDINRYIHTKFQAEEKMTEAIGEGLDGKIIRVGNLMSRMEDGEFQANFFTNSFMRRLKAYAVLGKYAVKDSDIEVEFSPIDSVAKAIILLAGVNKEFTVFHVNNCYTVHLATVLKTINDLGIEIKCVSNDEFRAEYNSKLADENYSTVIQSLVAYNHSDGKKHRMINQDNSFTVKALYRIGFSWDIIDNAYMKKAMEALKTLNFFNLR